MKKEKRIEMKEHEGYKFTSAVGFALSFVSKGA